VELYLYSPIRLHGVDRVEFALLLLQGDSLARGPKLVQLQIFNESVNQLTDD